MIGFPDEFDLTLNHLAVVGGFVLALLLFARIFRQHSAPTTSIAWLLAIVFMPYVGVPAYFLFGGRKTRQKAAAKNRLRQEEMCSTGVAVTENFATRILAASGMPPPRTGNRIELITEGEAAFARLMALIDSAQDSIDIETFIMADDRTGRAVAERLQARAKEGVQVRMLVDALGSLRSRLSLMRQLKRSGVKVGVFMRMMPIRRRWSANLRNHRKLALFDGRVALTGGMNIAEEYMGHVDYPGRWVDTCMVIEGSIIQDLASLFADDWEFATHEKSDPPDALRVKAAGHAVAQLATSGPDVLGDPLSDVVVSAIHTARERVWAVSPYFVPDEGIIRALKTQAHLGNDVRLILPRHSNHWTADMARNRILRELQTSGVRLFFDSKRMIHAKHVLIDEQLALSGSANLDLRSLYYNYEMAVLCYSPHTISAVATWCTELIDDCTEEQIGPPSFWRRWAEDLCWLLGPLL